MKHITTPPLQHIARSLAAALVMCIFVSITATVAEPPRSQNAPLHELLREALEAAPFPDPADATLLPPLDAASEQPSAAFLAALEALQHAEPLSPMPPPPTSAPSLAIAETASGEHTGWLEATSHPESLNFIDGTFDGGHTYAEALDILDSPEFQRLSGSNLETALRELVEDTSIGQLDGSIPDVTILFSGGDTPDGGDVPGPSAVEYARVNPGRVGVLMNTHAAELIQNHIFEKTILRAYNIPENSPQATHVIKQFVGLSRLDDGSRIPGVWDEISARFAATAKGQVVSLTAFSTPQSFFMVSEAPELLSNPNITSVNGLDMAKVRASLPSNGTIPVAALSEFIENVNLQALHMYAELETAALAGTSGKRSFTNLNAVWSRVTAGEALNLTEPPTTVFEVHGERTRFITPNATQTLKLLTKSRTLRLLGAVGTIIDIGLAAYEITELIQAGDNAGAVKRVVELAVEAALGYTGAMAAVAVGMIWLGLGPVGWGGNSGSCCWMGDRHLFARTSSQWIYHLDC